MIQLRNVPEALHRRLKARAATAGMSLSDYLLAEIRHVAERPTLERQGHLLVARPAGRVATLRTTTVERTRHGSRQTPPRSVIVAIFAAHARSVRPRSRTRIGELANPDYSGNSSIERRRAEAIIRSS